MDQDNVAIAFNIVLEEIENVIETLNQEGARAFQTGKHSLAKELAEKAEQITVLRNRVMELAREWTNMFGGGRAPLQPTPLQLQKETSRRRVFERLEPGRRTPIPAFRIPILESLVELGGSASVMQVLDMVENKLKHRLNQYDWQPLPSHPDQIRWRNAAQWARYILVSEGLLARDSPRGIWEITEKGRKYLADYLAKHSNK